MASNTLASSFSTSSRELRNSTPICDPPVAAAKQTQRTLESALLVGFGYYVGTRIGFAMTPVGQPNSTFWPPNAILLAAFLLAPRRIWWAFLVAVLPAHMLAQLRIGIPLWTAVGWFVTNTSEALIGAFCITRLTDRKTLFDNIRGVIVFVVFGVLIAPLATSFLDAAAVVVTGWGRSYWPLGAERFWTNALAALTLVPTIVIFGSQGVSWIRKATVSRYWEAALLAVATVLVTILIFGLPAVSPATTPALLYVPLPLLLWATVRFGSSGLSLSLLVIALISIWYTMHGLPPFPYASMPQNVLSLQILFSTAVVPLMFLSAVISEARRTQQSLRRISGRLIEAQEQERSRMARELHDDINQRLAMLAVELEQLRVRSPELKPENRKRVEQIREQTTAISGEVQALSHDLHSPQLEYLGAVAGMKSWCEDFGQRHGTQIDGRYEVSSTMPPDIGLCLFRVLQEALHNAVKHSGVKRIEVELIEDLGEIHLTIGDLGKGFDIEAARQGRGLGLTSMHERVRLVNGTIAIESKPMRGTTIRVRVPLESEQGA